MVACEHRKDKSRKDKSRKDKSRKDKSRCAHGTCRLIKTEWNKRIKVLKKEINKALKEIF